MFTENAGIIFTVKKDIFKIDHKWSYSKEENYGEDGKIVNDYRNTWDINTVFYSYPFI